MPVLSRAQASAAADDPQFQARVRSAMLDVAVDVHGGTGDYTQAQYDARAELAQAVCEAPDGYAEVFAMVITANEWTPTPPESWVVPGADNGSDPLLDTADGDYSLRLGVERVWDTIANTPVTVTP